MSLSVLVQCPHCHAQGNLADPALFGQEIRCPQCQQTFVAPVPTDGILPGAASAPVPAANDVPAAPIDVPGINQSSPTVTGQAMIESTLAVPPVLDNPAGTPPTAEMTGVDSVPTTLSLEQEPSPIVAADPLAANSIPVSSNFPVSAQPLTDVPLPAFLAPRPPGAEEIMFAQGLPEPAARGSVQPPKLMSKTVRMLVVGSVTAIVLFATIMFLMGDPLRGKKPQASKPVEETPAADKTPPGESIENIFDRINASSKSSDK